MNSRTMAGAALMQAVAMSHQISGEEIKMGGETEWHRRKEKTKAR